MRQLKLLNKLIICIIDWFQQLAISSRSCAVLEKVRHCLSTCCTAMVKTKYLFVDAGSAFISNNFELFNCEKDRELHKCVCRFDV